jgi:hypothetical protein
MKSMKAKSSKKMMGMGGNYVGGTVLDAMLQEVPSNVVGGKKPRKSKKMTGGSDAMAIPHMAIGGVASSSMGHTVGGKKAKSTRPLSAYNMFVKDNYEKSKHLPAKERMSHLAGLWKQSKK